MLKIFHGVLTLRQQDGLSLSCNRNTRVFKGDYDYRMAGPDGECILEGYWTNPNRDKHVTEIQVPVTKAES